MLVLSRRLNETIVINDDICITVVAVKGDRVRIGITAPKEMSVDRQEVHERRSEFCLAVENVECSDEQPNLRNVHLYQQLGRNRAVGGARPVAAQRSGA